MRKDIKLDEVDGYWLILDRAVLKSTASRSHNEQGLSPRARPLRRGRADDQLQRLATQAG